jgi:phenylalanine-4-hydroxylase
LTDGQRLSHHFELERVIRVLYRQHTQQDSYLTDQFHRLAELPHNR